MEEKFMLPEDLYKTARTVIKKLSEADFDELHQSARPAWDSALVSTDQVPIPSADSLTNFIATLNKIAKRSNIILPEGVSRTDRHKIIVAFFIATNERYLNK